MDLMLLTFHHHPPLLSQILVLLPSLQVVCLQICPLHCSVHMSCFLDQRPIAVKKKKKQQEQQNYHIQCDAMSYDDQRLLIDYQYLSNETTFSDMKQEL